MAETNLLQVEQVSKQFDELLAVSQASFEVKRGEVFGLLGPNGAGKTTLIRMILGILHPDTGKITMTLNGSSAALQKAHVGYLPEERGLYEERKIGEILVYFAHLHGMAPLAAKEKALYWLSRFGLQDRFHWRLKELSKGNQQKIQFIAAVLHQPDLVVLDEPFSGLDPLSQDLIRDLIKELSEAGVTILLSAHQMNLVETLCDRVFLIHRGHRVLYGNLNEIKSEHGTNVVWIRYKKLNEPELRSRLQQQGIAMISIGPQEIELLLPKNISPNDVLGVINNHVEIDELTITRPSLHRVFVEIVKKSQ